MIDSYSHMCTVHQPLFDLTQSYRCEVLGHGIFDFFRYYGQKYTFNWIYSCFIENIQQCYVLCIIIIIHICKLWLAGTFVKNCSLKISVIGHCYAVVNSGAAGRVGTPKAVTCNWYRRDMMNQVDWSVTCNWYRRDMMNQLDWSVTYNWYRRDMMNQLDWSVTCNWYRRG